GGRAGRRPPPGRRDPWRRRRRRPRSRATGGRGPRGPGSAPEQTDAAAAGVHAALPSGGRMTLGETMAARGAGSSRRFLGSALRLLIAVALVALVLRSAGTASLAERFTAGTAVAAV